MVWHLGMTDSAEVNRIIEPEPFEPILGHHRADIDVALTAPIEFVPLEPEPVNACRRLHRGDPFGHYLAPDAVPGDDCNPVILRHSPLPPTTPSSRPERFRSDRSFGKTPSPFSLPHWG